jgi:hypothetical protein
MEATIVTNYRKVFKGLLELGRRKGMVSLSQGVAVDRYQIKSEA